MQLTDAQLLTACIAIIVPLSLLIYSNSRISEAKETLRAETAKLGAELRAETVKLGAELRGEMTELRGEIQLLRSEMAAGFVRIEQAFKMHVLEHHQ